MDIIKYQVLQAAGMVYIIPVITYKIKNTVSEPNFYWQIRDIQTNLAICVGLSYSQTSGIYYFIES